MRKAFLQLHIAVFLAGFTAVLGKLILLNEAALVWWRLLIALMAFAALCMVQKLAQPPIGQRKAYLGVGALIGLHWLLFFGSVKYGGVSVALVTFSASGFFSALLKPFMKQGSLVVWEVILGLLGMAGIYVIYEFSHADELGIVLGIGAAFLSAVFSHFNKQLIATSNGIVMSCYEMAGAFIMVSLVLPFYHWSTSLMLTPNWSDILYLLILALLCTVWAFVLQLQSLRKISAVTLNLSYNLEPVYGILLAIVFFGEHQLFTASFSIGLALIVISVALQSYRTAFVRA